MKDKEKTMKNYTIKQVADKLGIPATTIRYYDKEGLLTGIERKESGYRIFSEDDIETLETIECLKKSGMSIKEVKQCLDWNLFGDENFEKRIAMYEQRKEIVKAQIDVLEKTLEFIECHRDYAIASRDNDEEAMKREYAHCARLLKELR